MDTDWPDGIGFAAAARIIVALACWSSKVSREAGAGMAGVPDASCGQVASGNEPREEAR
jgi:hypothetical protein